MGSEVMGLGGRGRCGGTCGGMGFDDSADSGAGLSGVDECEGTLS